MSRDFFGFAKIVAPKAPPPPPDLKNPPRVVSVEDFAKGGFR
jgi:hypothetical protein